MIAVVSGNVPMSPQIDMSVVMKTHAATTIAAASANFQATNLCDFCFFISFSFVW